MFTNSKNSIFTDYETWHSTCYEKGIVFTDSKNGHSFKIFSQIIKVNMVFTVYESRYFVLMIMKVGTTFTG